MNRIVTTIFLTIALCIFLALGQQESKAATDSKGKENQIEQTLRQIENDTVNALAFQHIGILSLEFHVDKLSRPLL